MTAGLPGAGIGGLFYILSALGMPFHAAFVSARRRLGSGRESTPPVKWRPIVRQFTIAAGIVAALWLTGWALARMIELYPASIGTMQRAPEGRHVPNVLKIGVLVLSFGTLTLVLSAVQVARILLRRRRAVSVHGAAAVIVALALLGAPARAQTGSPPGSAAAHLRAAESAYAEGNEEVARQQYTAVLVAEPDNPRALFRLGLLTRGDSRRALPLFRNYVRVVPGDAWGHMALADELSRGGNLSEALREYDIAARIAPGERDVWLGRARVLANHGHTDDAIATLEHWTSSHADDAEALRDLGDQRRRAGRLAEAAAAYRMSASHTNDSRTSRRLKAVRAALAPAVDVVSSGAGDSDQNRSYRVGASANAAAGDRGRIAVGGGWKRITGFTDASVRDASVSLYARPGASLRFEATAGAVQSSADTTGVGTGAVASVGQNPVSLIRNSVVPGRSRGNGGKVVTPPPGTVFNPRVSSDRTIPIGSARAVWKQPGSTGMLDVRVSRALLDATSILVLNGVVRNEIAARADVPLVGRVLLRGGAKANTYDGATDSNTRTALLGGLAVTVADAVEVSGMFQNIAFDHSTTSGYFAPRIAQLAEVGSYAEVETDGGTVLVLDGGLGAQRFADFGAAMTTWKPAFRLFAQLTVPLRPGSQFRAELDSYDSRLSSEAASGTSWRYASGSVSLRFALR